MPPSFVCRFSSSHTFNSFGRCFGSNGKPPFAENGDVASDFKATWAGLTNEFATFTAASTMSPAMNRWYVFHHPQRLRWRLSLQYVLHITYLRGIGLWSELPLPVIRFESIKVTTVASLGDCFIWSNPQVGLITSARESSEEVFDKSSAIASLLQQRYWCMQSPPEGNWPIFNHVFVVYWNVHYDFRCPRFLTVACYSTLRSWRTVETSRNPKYGYERSLTLRIRRKMIGVMICEGTGRVWSELLTRYLALLLF